MAGQRLNGVRAAGLMTGTSIVLDELSAHQPTGPGVLALRGAYDLNAGEYTVSIDGAEWVLAATADQPLGGRMHIRFAGAGTAKNPRGTGHVTLADARWQGVMWGDLDASVRLDGQVADIDAKAPDFDAVAIARVQLDAPYAALVDAQTGSLDLARVLQDVETPGLIAGSANLAVHFEGPLDRWRAGSVALDVASLDAIAGDLPIHLAQPVRLRYEAERVFVDSLEADVGGTRLSASGALPVFEPAQGDRRPARHAHGRGGRGGARGGGNGSHRRCGHRRQRSGRAPRPHHRLSSSADCCCRSGDGTGIHHAAGCAADLGTAAPGSR